VQKPTVEKGHGLSRRAVTPPPVRSTGSHPRKQNIKTIVKVHERVEYANRSFDTRYYISSATPDIERTPGAREVIGASRACIGCRCRIRRRSSRYRTATAPATWPIVRRFARPRTRQQHQWSVKTSPQTAGGFGVLATNLQPKSVNLIPTGPDAGGSKPGQ
jgi:hypothetical protein